jgi:hypothetical protein
MSKQTKNKRSLSEEDLNANVKKLKTQNLNFQVAFTFTFLKKSYYFKITWWVKIITSTHYH